MRRIVKELVIIVLAVIAAIYLLNPTAGLIELLPDALPVVGNLDEAGAVTILISTLGYYGIDMSRLYGTRKSNKKVRRITRNAEGEIIKEEIVDAE